MSNSLLSKDNLSEVYKRELKEIRNIVGNSLEQRMYTIVAEVKYINEGRFGTNFVTVFDENGTEIQMKVVEHLSRGLEREKTYIFTGHFEVGYSAEFGALQFKPRQIESFGSSFRTMQQQAVSKELIESQYLNKYKNDFSSFLGKQACHVALVTSGQSKAIHDVEEVFKRRPGIVKSIHRVRLNDSKSIAFGIFEASESTADVIMVVRGGGKDTDFLVFDSVEVIQEIYNTSIPVITGLGHTSNLTLADQAADRCETTPTKAAQFLVDRLGDTVFVIQEKKANYKTYDINTALPVVSTTKKKRKVIIIWSVVIFLSIVALILALLTSSLGR
ncbi:exodeoxyribonuclease VII large subunit [Paenibacillus senegalimassiliensis]|uniref:exodeoxyribonuclease VII large subunit n=1 Tax=Paenibacillus senegalimassiliensis TaxID=1737426 RepID=UPI00073EE748|nr:exodeoxyribonuclease VII large subunit [Paenibacillus senegalimassiliensis]